MLIFIFGAYVISLCVRLSMFWRLFLIFVPLFLLLRKILQSWSNSENKLLLILFSFSSLILQAELIIFVVNVEKHTKRFENLICFFFLIWSLSIRSQYFSTFFISYCIQFKNRCRFFFVQCKRFVWHTNHVHKIKLINQNPIHIQDIKMFYQITKP